MSEQADPVKHLNAVRKLGFVTQLERSGTPPDTIRKCAAAYEQQHAARVDSLTKIHATVKEASAGSSAGEAAK